MLFQKSNKVLKLAQIFQMCIRDSSTSNVQRVLYLLVTLPMCMSFLLRTLALVSLVRDTGIINNFLGIFGIGPLPLIRNAGSVIMGMVYNLSLIHISSSSAWPSPARS